MKLDFEKLNENQSKFELFIDSVMLFLIVFNLAWMIFDFSFTAHFFRSLVYEISPKFHKLYYLKIHPDFLFFDFFFVLIFLSEFLVRWIIAVYRKTYDSWMSFPFVFWYDLLGCIPLASFRFLRLFRIVSLLIRLQKKEVIDVTDTWWYKMGNKTFHMFVEEVSDRVSVNILTGVQKELEYGAETNQMIIDEVIEPRKKEFSKWIASRLQFAISESYLLHKDDIRSYFDISIQKAVSQSEEINKLEKVPVVGKQISSALAGSISDISYQVLEVVLNDLLSEKGDEIVFSSLNIALNTASHQVDNRYLEQVATEIVSDSIDILKRQVNKKHYDK